MNGWLMRCFIVTAMACVCGTLAAEYTDEEIADICASVPTDDEIAEFEEFNFHAGPQCDNCNPNSNSAMCQACQTNNDNELPVLTIFIRCFRDACAESDQRPGVEKCLDRMHSSIQNIFQFTVKDQWKQQMQKTCDCGYPSTNNEETADGITHCDFRSIYNCRFDTEFCLNTIDIVDNQTKLCVDTSDDALERAKQRIEWGRIQKYCEMEMKLMLTDEGVGQDRCDEEWQHKEDLTSFCSQKCYYKMRDIPFDYNPYISGLNDYMWNYDCGHFDEDYDHSDNSYDDDWWFDTVYFRGMRKTWHGVADACQQYIGTGDLTQDPLKVSPYPRPFMNNEDFLDALGECCNPDINYYEDLFKYEDALFGQYETECLDGKRAALDFGFFSNILRGLLWSNTGDCWQVESEYDTCTLLGDYVPCSSNPDQMKLTDGGLIEPKNIFWFLRYLTDDLDLKKERIWALQGCRWGAKLGKSVGPIPGNAISLEAQTFAQTGDDPRMAIPFGYRSLFFAGFQTCGVMAAMDANGYYEDDAACNDDYILKAAHTTTCSR